MEDRKRIKNVQLSAVRADQDALADDLRGAADVLEHLLVDVGERAVVGADRNTLALVGLAKHGTLGDEDNMVLVELLLELADEACFDGKTIQNLLLRLPLRTNLLEIVS